MADPGPSDERRRRSGLLGLIGRWARGGGPADEERAPADEAAAESTRELVDHAQAFHSIRVEDVMSPRADVIGVDESTPFEDVLRLFAESEHSRMPIYRENLDDPIGVVHIKDMVKLLIPGAERPPEPVLPSIRREALYVPASMRAADLLVRMQATRLHMALVIDEFGGTDGLVTLEDLLEAVVGDIDDEHDVDATPQVIVRPGGWEADARAPLEELEAQVGAELTPDDEEEEIETVGGLVATLAGRVPQRGELIAHPGGFEFEVTDADPRRIKRVRVRRTGTPAPDASPAA